MKLRLLCVGKLGNAQLKALAAEYQKRLERLCDLEIVELKDAEDRDGASRLAREAERIKAAAEPLSDCILWDETGDEMDSRAFSRFLEKLETGSAKKITFIIGSSHGIDE